jgi:hypothetical protein
VTAAEPLEPLEPFLWPFFPFWGACADLGELREPLASACDLSTGRSGKREEDDDLGRSRPLVSTLTELGDAGDCLHH